MSWFYAVVLFGSIWLHFGFYFRGKKFLELPYVVKGMDVSFSGLLSFIEVSAVCAPNFFR